MRTSLPWRVSLVGTLVLVCSLISSSPALAIPPCNQFDYDVFQYDNDRGYWGVEGLIGTPTFSYLYDPYHAQIVDFVGVLDARLNRPVFNGCSGADCQIQAGNARGTIVRSDGARFGTFGTNPYVEEYDKNGGYVAVYNQFGIGNLSTRYNVYDTGMLDSAGFHYLVANYNNQSGTSATLGGGYWVQGSNFGNYAQAEMQNFDAPNQPCPIVTHQEFGTHGYGTYQDYYSQINLLTYPDHTYVHWPAVSTSTGGLIGAGGVAGGNPPYFGGYFDRFGAWNVESS